MIINGLTADNNLRNSIFAFGGGKTVDRYLLDLLAYRNKGEAEVVKNIEDIDDDLPKFFQRLSDPLLVDLNADFGRINEAKVFPSVLPDFYRGQPVTVYGRFDPKKDREFFMRLSGRAADRKKELIFRTDLREAAGADREIARSWAFQKAYHLIGEISRQGETPELLGQLQELSQKYNIRTSYNP
jgi:Ca-activated chloride channel family protein